MKITDKRRLALSKETLVHLNPAQLRRAGGATVKDFTTEIHFTVDLAISKTDVAAFTTLIGTVVREWSVGCSGSCISEGC
jgi:hypothetical protein